MIGRALTQALTRGLRRISTGRGGAVALLLCAGVMPCSAAEWFVDAVNGVDAAGRGTQAEAAMRTIQFAVDAAAAGDTITLLPGDHAEGVRVMTSSSYTSRTRVWIDKPLTLRSQRGRATRDTTRILGEWDKTDSAAYPHGMGPGAVRCVWVTGNGAGSRFEGLTFEQGAAPYYSNAASGHSCGGGIYVANNKAATVVDCAFRDCQATRGGGVYSDEANGAIVVARTLFKRCRATKYGQAARGASLYNCVLDDNDMTRLADGTVKGDDMVWSAGAAAYCWRIVNCTVVNNAVRAIGCGKDDFSGGVYNCLALNNGGNAVEVASARTHNLVSDRSSYVDNNCQVVNIYDSSEVYDTRDEDYRLVRDAVAKTAGAVEWLALIPEEFRATDYYGNLRATDGVVACGAVQAACTNVTSGLSIPRQAKFGTADALGTMCLDGEPVTCAFRMIVQRPGPCVAFNVAFKPPEGLHLLHYSVGNTQQWPKRDGSAWLSPNKGHVQSIGVGVTTNAFWVDATAGDDAAGDGSAAQPWRTLQRAVDEVAASNVNAVVYTRAGDYAEGGAALFGHNSRVAVPGDYGKYLRVVAVEGPEATFISGESDPDSKEYGIGPNARRCLAVAMTSGAAAFQGFTLRGGRTGGTSGSTSAETFGAGLANNAGSYKTGVLLDCVVTNCAGGRGAAVYGGLVYRSRLIDCRIINAGLARKAKVYSSVISGINSGGTPILNDGGCLYNCTLVRNSVNAIANAKETGGKGYAYNSVLAARTAASYETISNVLEEDQVLYTLYDTAAGGNVFPTCIEQNPVCFRNAAAGDWSLLKDSSGTRLASPDYWSTPMDFNGNPFVADVEGRYPVGAFATQAAATTYYADAANGDDARDGLTEATAVKTLKAALEKAAGGDVVVALPGVYNEGTTLQTLGQSGGKTTPTIPARAVVPSYVTLTSRDGAQATVIEGALDNGDCGPNAVRCVFLARWGTLRGFTLRNGATDQGGAGVADTVNTHGGGVLGFDGSVNQQFDETIENCIITNCRAVRGGGGCYGTYRNCQFLGNTLCVDKPGVAVRLARMEGCYLAGNRGGHSTVYQCDVRNCTVMDGQASGTGLVHIESDYLKSRALVNSVILGKKYSAAAVTNCVFVSGSANTYAGAEPVDCRTASVDELALDGDGRPARVSVLVDAGAADVTSGELLAAGDIVGNPRVSNGRLDVGAFEYDWRGDYAATLAPRHLAVVEADAGVTLAETGVALPAGGALVVEWTVPSAGQLTFSLALTGAGTLTVRIGEEELTFTEAGTFRLPGAEGVNRITFAYSAEDGSTVVLSGFRQANGTILVIR
ncbi:MAG: hypothetical protein ACI4RA_08645 [Kiritimatiellia bacterium]